MTRLQRGRALFCAAALISLIFSVTLWFLGDHDAALFVGLWVPSVLSLGSLLVGRGGGS